MVKFLKNKIILTVILLSITGLVYFSFDFYYSKTKLVLGAAEIREVKSRIIGRKDGIQTKDVNCSFGNCEKETKQITEYGFYKEQKSDRIKGEISRTEHSIRYEEEGAIREKFFEKPKWVQIGALKEWRDVEYHQVDKAIYDQEIYQITFFERLLGVAHADETFTSSGTFTKPAGITSFNVLVVAGGGGGSGMGAGGAGGMKDQALTISADQTITVGAGGLAGKNNGDNSSIGSLLVLTGGGGGGDHDQNAPAKNGANGGSGGGAGGGDADNATFGTGTAGQGNNGGTFFGSGNGALRGGGGGGGAGGVGGNGSSATGGLGGAGTSSSRSGSPVTYAAGGEGASGSGDTNAAGGANTGNGGGSNAAGGSGIVIITWTVSATAPSQDSDIMWFQ